MKLNPGATRFNVVSLFLGSFAASIMVHIMSSFAIYLLDDRHHITDKEAGRILGNIGTISDLVAIVSQLFLGSLMDLVGRKKPSIIGLLMASLGILFSPLPPNIPGLYVCHIMIQVGCLPFLWSPYSVDYI